MADPPLATEEMRRLLRLNADRQYGIDPGPDNPRGYAFNQFLPVSTNKVGSASWVQEGAKPQWAVPEALQGGLLGVAGMADAPRTGKLTPEALGSLLTGSTMTGGLLAPRGSLAAGGSIKAYHGSPHDFDRFDASRIGTGEGNQVYGHGLYFAGNEEVARSYKKAGDYATRQVDVINGELSRIAREMDKYHGGEYGKYTDPRGYELKAQYDALMQKRSDLGHMYEVNINADPKRFLDWDKRMAEQSPEVQRAVKQTVERAQAEAANGPFAMHGQVQGAAGTEVASPERLSQLSGAATNQMLQKVYGGPLQSQRLSEAGIPGIKYLDQGSRGGGEGTSNYVVFPTQEEIIKILRKYGLAAPSPAVPVAQGPASPPGLLSDRQSEVPTKDRVY